VTLPPLTVIPAGAGSGKTFSVQERLADLVVAKEVRPEGIVAVTFTEAAAGELRDRIRGELLRRGRVEDALRLDRAYISTIHSFGRRLLREHAFEAGMSPEPRLLDDGEERILVAAELARTRRADEVMRNLGRFGYRFDWGARLGAEELFRRRVRNLIGRLRTIGRTGEDPALVEHACGLIAEVYGAVGDADALSGRLRATAAALLDRFPADLSPAFAGNKTASSALRGDFRRITRAAAGEDLEHDFRLWQSLRDLRQSKRGSALPEGYDALADAVMEAADALPFHPGPRDDACAHVSALLGAAGDSVARYTEAKRERGLLDYTDMVASARELLAGSAEAGRAFLPSVDCLVVDEFQDTNPLQFALLETLRSHGVPTIVVGDLKQAIMGFQGADPRLLDALAKGNPEAVDPLTANWRSTPELMRFLNRAGRGLFGDAYTDLTPRATYASSLDPLEALVATGKAKAKELRSAVAARVRELLDDEDATVHDRRTGTSRRIRGEDVAILCLTHRYVEQYAEALRGFGVRPRIERTGWLDSPAVALARQALAYVADPGDRHAALYLSVTDLGRTDLADGIGRLLDGERIGDPVLARLDEVAAGRPDRAVPEILGEIVRALDLNGRFARGPDPAQDRADLLRLQSAASEFLAANAEAKASGRIHGGGIKSFLAWISASPPGEDRRPEPRVRDLDAVEVLTWHSAKGREWPVVFVASTSTSTAIRLPDLSVSYSSFDDLDRVLERARIEHSPNFAAPETNRAFRSRLEGRALEEARRLLYVALTRAREKLVLEIPGPGKDYGAILRSALGLEIGDDSLLSAGEEFPCRVVLVPEMVRSDDDACPEEPRPVVGRRALAPGDAPDGGVPEETTPSSLHGEEAGEPPGDLLVDRYGPPLAALEGRDPAERGTLLHRAFEVLGRHPERAGILPEALGVALDSGEIAAIAAAAAAFDAWLETLSPLQVGAEVPILFSNAAGTVVHGIADLLVETEEGYWVIDHKSDRTNDRAGRFALYRPQLDAYAAAVRAARPEKPVLGVGVNWISHGETARITCV